MKGNKGIISKIIISIILSIIIESVVLNFFNIIEIMDTRLDKNIEYTMDKMEYINWQDEGTNKVSDLDPIIYIKGVNTWVKEIQVNTKLNQRPNYMLLWYTNKEHQEVSEERAISAMNITGKDEFTINGEVKDIRLDLGNQDGLVLEDIHIIINPVQFDFSIARVIAMILIYWGFIGLFRVQQTPDYKL